MKHVLCVSTSQSVNPLYAWVLVRIIPNLWNQVTSLISGNRVKVKLRHKFTWYQIPISGPVPCLATDNELLGCGQSFWNVTERRSFFVLFHGTDAFSLFVNYFGKPEQKHSFWSVTICHPVHVVLTNKWLQILRLIQRWVSRVTYKFTPSSIKQHCMNTVSERKQTTAGSFSTCQCDA